MVKAGILLVAVALAAGPSIAQHGNMRHEEGSGEGSTSGGTSNPGLGDGERGPGVTVGEGVSATPDRRLTDAKTRLDGEKEKLERQLLEASNALNRRKAEAGPIIDQLRDARARIADLARSYLGVTDWTPRNSLLSDTPRYLCNFFVADVLEEAGTGTSEIDVPVEDGTRVKRIPLAREWADTNQVIPGWVVVFPNEKTNSLNREEILALREPGDVLASDGHVGIVSDEEGRTISVSSRSEPRVPTPVGTSVSPRGMVVLNDWGFRSPPVQASSGVDWSARAMEAARRITVRRYVGGGPLELGPVRVQPNPAPPPDGAPRTPIEF